MLHMFLFRSNTFSIKREYIILYEFDSLLSYMYSYDKDRKLMCARIIINRIEDNIIHNINRIKI